MNEKLLALALAGGIVLSVSVFVEWSATSGNSAWDTYDSSILASAVMVLLGVVFVAVLGIENVGAMIPVGALIALIQGIQNYRAYADFDADIGIGVWLAIIGGILAVVGTLGLGEESLGEKISERI